MLYGYLNCWTYNRISRLASNKRFLRRLACKDAHDLRKSRTNNEPARVCVLDRIAAYVCIEVYTARDSDRVLADEPLEHRIVVPRPVVAER